jgi:hydrogenase maturation protease
MTVRERILIAGIGNIFLGDDGFGCEALRRLMAQTWPDSVRVVDFGIRGFDLVYALMDGYDVTILVDAVPRGGQPGTLYTIEPDLSELDSLGPQDAMVETHGMNPMKALAMVKSMGGELKRVLLVGCEPETFGPEEGQMGLSASVEAAVDEATRIVESLVEKILREQGAPVTV